MSSISIVTVCLNAERHIASCLDSVAGQTVAAEHIVVDGGSTDRTLAILQASGNSRVSVVSEPDDGMYDALNKGIARASGDIVGLLHADDYFAGDSVLARVQSSFADPAVASCYGDLEYVDNEPPNKVVRYWRSGGFSKKRFLWGWMPPHPTFFVRREVYERLGGFRLDLGTAADYELMLRYLYKHEIGARYIPEVLTRMRVGGQSNINMRARLRANRMDRLAWSKNDLTPYPWTIPLKPLRKLGQWL